MINPETNQDYTLAPGSVAIGAANAAVVGLPGFEYYQNEANCAGGKP